MQPLEQKPIGIFNESAKTLAEISLPAHSALAALRDDLPDDAEIATALESLGEDATVDRIRETRDQLVAVRLAEPDEEYDSLAEEVEAARSYEEETSIGVIVHLDTPERLFNALLSAYSEVDELLDNVASSMPEGLTREESRVQRRSNAMRDAIQEKFLAVIHETTARAQLVSQLARMTPDGEDGSVMSNDDAVSTLSTMIREARRVEQVEPASTQPSEPDPRL